MVFAGHMSDTNLQKPLTPFFQMFWYSFLGIERECRPQKNPGYALGGLKLLEKMDLKNGDYFIISKLKTTEKGEKMMDSQVTGGGCFADNN